MDNITKDLIETLHAHRSRANIDTTLSLKLKKSVSGEKIIDAAKEFITNYNVRHEDKLYFVEKIDHKAQYNKKGKPKPNQELSEFGISGDREPFHICIITGNEITGYNYKIKPSDKIAELNINACIWVDVPEKVNYIGNGRTAAMNEIKSGLEEILNK